MRSIKANTPEEYRDAVVNHLKWQSVNKSAASRIVKLKTSAKLLQEKSNWYMMLAIFFEQMPIEK